MLSRRRPATQRLRNRCERILRRGQRRWVGRGCVPVAIRRVGQL